MDACRNSYTIKPKPHTLSHESQLNPNQALINTTLHPYKPQAVLVKPSILPGGGGGSGKVLGFGFRFRAQGLGFRV